jgi:hypothetical protein
MANRTDIYEAINAERRYQDNKWGHHKHSVVEYLVYIRDYTEEALHKLSREDDFIGDEFALHSLRKITALGVACMEEHGVLSREQQ